MEDKCALLKKWINESSSIVFLGGAGVSTESGIPDFRGKGGLYRKKSAMPLEIALSHEFFMAHPEEFYQLVRPFMARKEARPNQAHIRLAQLEREGRLKYIITQNVDGLHQKAGSRNVLELHGNDSSFFCMNCDREYPAVDALASSGVPTCACGGILRPGIVMFGEPLPFGSFDRAAQAIANAEMLIVAGTSLVVYPAAGLIDYYKGDKLALINEQPTPYDREADLIIREKVGEVFAKV